MNVTDWILGLHVLSALALVVGILIVWFFIARVRRTETPQERLRLARVTRFADIATGVGMGGTIVFGVWLALSVGYDLWDEWILAAFVLWLVVGALRGRTRAAFGLAVKKAEELKAAGQAGPSAELRALNRTSKVLVLQALTSLTVLVIVIDMIWKPGT